jgi:HEAT repeat protein
MNDEARLKQELQHPDPEVRWIALAHLAGCPEPWGTALLIEALENREFESIRWQAAILLGRREDRAAVPALIRCLGDANHHVREEAAEALGKIGDARAAEALTAALDDPVRSVRLRAAKALEQLEHWGER